MGSDFYMNPPSDTEVRGWKGRQRIKGSGKVGMTSHVVIVSASTGSTRVDMEVKVRAKSPEKAIVAALKAVAKWQEERA